MKILYLPVYFNPEKAASSYLGENRNQAFADAGIRTLAFVPTPCRGISDDVRKMYCRKEYHKEILYNGKMELHRFPIFREGRNPLRRAFRYFLVSLNQFYYGIKAKDIDLIYVASTPPTQGALAALVKKLKHIPFVYNLQDIFPDSLVGTGLAKKGGLLWKIGRVIENFTYRNADKIIVISEDFKRNIMAKGVPEEKIEVIYNWVDEEAIVPITDDENPLFSEFSIEKDSFRVVYAGNLGHAQNIKIILEAASKLKDDESIKFIIFGKGGLENDIRERIKKEGLTNVMLLPLQPYDRVSYVYSLGNVDVVSCKEGLGGSAMPSKTWSIMSTGRPVLASFDEGELKTIIEKNDCGVFTKAGDIDAFVGAIKQLASQKERCAEMGRNGREFILHNLTKEVGTRKYVDVIKQFEG